jgi:signal transduction histidine kinase
LSVSPAPPPSRAGGPGDAPVAAPAATATATESGWRRLLGERSFAAQALLLATAVGLALAGLAGGAAGAVHWGWIAAAAITLALWLLVRSTALGLRRLTQQARAIEREALGGADSFESLAHHHELRRLSMALRRLVQAGRQRIDDLLARNQQLGQQLSVRSHQLQSLEALSIGLAQKTGVAELIDEALGALGHTLEYTSASIWSRHGQSPGEPVRLLGCASPLLDDERVAQFAGARLSRGNVALYEQIEHSRETVVEDHARQSVLSWLWNLISDDADSSTLHRTSRSWAALPLLSRQEVVGVLRVDHEEPGYFDAERLRLLQAVASQTALALRHAELADREREFAVAAERTRIARDLHDAVSQTLFAANMIASAMVRNAEAGTLPDPVAAAAQAGALERLNRGALAEMRLLMFELRPDALERTDLAELLQHAADALISRGSTRVVVALERGLPLADAHRVHLYRIAQSALGNIARHSQATSAKLSWQRDDPDHAVLRISDDGCGFDPAQVPAGHFGVANIHERGALCGAELSLRSAPGAGTEWRLRVPLAHAQPAATPLFPKPQPTTP